MATKETKCDVLRRLAKANPNTTKSQLARIALRRYPGMFSSFDVARTAVRDIFGAHGTLKRAITANKEMFAPYGTVFDGIPKPKQDLVWKPVDVNNDCSLVLSDLHVPWHEPDALRPALDYGLEHNADCIILMGDISDCYALSKFTHERSKEYLADSLRATWTILCLIRDAFPKARIIYKLGNHEERWLDFFCHHGRELFEMAFTRFAFVMQTPKVFGVNSERNLDIDWVEDRVPLRIAKLWLLHGHELPKAPSNPVNAARNTQLKTGECVLVGHWHQSSKHRVTTLADRVITCFSQGCLCNLHPRYSPFNPTWMHGFSLVHRDDENNFTVEDKIVLGGKVY